MEETKKLNSLRTWMLPSNISTKEMEKAWEDGEQLLARALLKRARMAKKAAIILTCLPSTIVLISLPQRLSSDNPHQ